MLVERKEYFDEDNSLGYVESVFESSNILKTTYFPKLNRLYIAFDRGQTYSYGNITPEFYKDFEEVESQGQFFHKKINKKKEYPYRKEFTLYPNEIKDLKQIVEENKKDIDEE